MFYWSVKDRIVYIVKKAINIFSKKGFNGGGATKKCLRADARKKLPPYTNALVRLWNGETVVVVFINSMKTTFGLNFCPSFQTAWIHIKMETNKLSFNNFFLFTCKLRIINKLFRNKNLIVKSSSLYWYKHWALLMLIFCHLQSDLY